MNFKDITHHEFWLERLSWKAKEAGTDRFTKEEIEWAILQTEYKYFGDYEFSDQQQMAVDILVWAAGQYVLNGVDSVFDDDNPTNWGE